MKGSVKIDFRSSNAPQAMARIGQPTSGCISIATVTHAHADVQGRDLNKGPRGGIWLVSRLREVHENI